MSKFTGTGVALITPFNADLSIDFDALEAIIEHNITNGTNYLVLCGTTGESVTITSKEKQQLIHFVTKVNKGRLPIVLGIGGNNTQAVINEIATTNLSQIDAILSVSPYYSKPTQQGISAHFGAIAKASPKPIIVYNVPGRTSSNMLPQTIVDLANANPNIIGVKEASGHFGQYLELLRIKPHNFHVISGDDDLALSVTLAGGSGVISVIGQALTDTFTQMIQLGLAKNAEEAYRLQYQLLPLIHLIFAENNPAGIKAVLHHLKLAKPYVRLPLVEATESSKNAIETYLKVQQTIK